MTARMGETGIQRGQTTAFLTDSTLCIGCKAWNGIDADGLELSGFSYDNTMAPGHSTWRHVKFVEGTPEPGVGGNDASQVSWEFSSDVCKHCEVAGCLEACPTGALVRTEFGGVYLQPDICNGCGHCVISCPFGVVQKNEQDGRAFKCTFCTDRQKAGLQPACAKACPTESIKFGLLDDLRSEATRRLETLHGRGMQDAQLYNPVDTSVGGIHSLFLIRGKPQTYNLPPQPEVPTIYLQDAWKSATVEALAMVAGITVSFLLWRRSGNGGR